MSEVATVETTRAREVWKMAQPWLSLAVRVAMAVILIFAAIGKMQDLQQSVRAVRAYQLLPEAVVPVVGVGLPFFELVLAALLLAGLFTRWSSIVWTIMIIGFVIGVAWAWAKGLNIDCGCFGGGGEVPEGSTNYPMHMLERAGFLALGIFLMLFPKSPFSLDSWIRVEPEGEAN